MLQLQACFERKASSIYARDTVISAVETLPHDTFLEFRSNLLHDYDFLAAHQNAMFVDQNDIRHALLVLDDASDDGILVDSQGYSYARYSSWLPCAKPYLQSQMQQLSDEIIQDSTQKTRSGSWFVSFADLQKRYDLPFKSGNGLCEMLLDALAERAELAEIEPTDEGLDMTFYLDHCPNLEEPLEDLSSVQSM